jgi:tyrosyl-tRNA synthetase
VPRMSEEVAENVLWLSTQDKFQSLMEHFEKIRDELQIQINDPLTPKDEREIAVFVRQQLEKEVINVIKTAQHILSHKERNKTHG